MATVLNFIDQEDNIYSCFSTHLGIRVVREFPYDSLRDIPYLACCESVEELAFWACGQVGIDPYETTLQDPKTGEILYIEDLEANFL